MRTDRGLLLSPLTNAARALQEERREAGKPVLSLTTPDCAVTYRCAGTGAASGSCLNRSGREYGGIDAVFEDGCGNLLNLHEE